MTERNIRQAVVRLLPEPAVRMVARMLGRVDSEAEKRLDENKLIAKAFRRVHMRGQMVDVGAHFGGSLTPFARAGWRILAFEPDEENRKVLIARTERMSRRLTVDSRAVGDEAAESVQFYRSATSTGISSMIPFDASHVPCGTVSVTTLRAAFMQHGVDGVTYLKIDAEGLDLPILRGYPWDAMPPPAVVLCEFEDAKTRGAGYDYHVLADFLVDHGYQLIVSEWFPLEKYGSGHRWRHFRKYPCDLSDSRAWGNIIAVQSSSPLAERIQVLCSEIRQEG